MIVLDTHIWLWWVHGDERLTKKQAELLQAHEKKGLAVSVISCWEIAKLVEYQLTKKQAELLQAHEKKGLAVSVISCWEIAKLVEYQRLVLPCPIDNWLTLALSYPNIELLHLTPQIVVEATQLPQPFHRDPADQLIVATARICGCPLMTLDGKIRNYPHVDLIG